MATTPDPSEETGETDERRAVVHGPITGSQRPWGAPPEAELTARGYRVDEYQLEGDAVAYQFAPGTSPGPDGRWEVAEWGRAPYRTRILVIRPDDPSRFNGTVVVSWQNVSAGYETPAPRDGEIYDGYAWVGVSAQEVGIYGAGMAGHRYPSSRSLPLVDHDPERYGSLRHPGDQGSFDIFSQAGRAVGPRRSEAHPSGATPDPLDGLPVERLVAVGGSQSAMRLCTYVNAVHSRDRVFDGFVLTVWEGRAPRPEEGSMPAGVRTAVRADLDTPIIIVNSEFEAPAVAALGMADTETMRIWEVAGTPHGNSRRTELADSKGRVGNRLSYAPVYESALRAMHRWLGAGEAAPHQPRMVYDDHATIVRDEHGNARGGIRLPELEAPTHEYRGVAFGTGRLPLFGSARPFATDTLRSLYPTRADHDTRWEAAVDRLVASGAVRESDAAAMKAKAAAVRLPTE